MASLSFWGLLARRYIFLSALSQFLFGHFIGRRVLMASLQLVLNLIAALWKAFRAEIFKRKKEKKTPTTTSDWAIGLWTGTNQRFYLVALTLERSFEASDWSERTSSVEGDWPIRVSRQGPTLETSTELNWTELNWTELDLNRFTNWNMERSRTIRTFI